MSLSPTKQSADSDSARQLTSISTGSTHSLSGIPELGGFGIRVPLSSMAVTAVPPHPTRMSAKHRSRSGDIRAPIAKSEELSPMTPMSLNHSQSSDLLQLVPDAKYMANQSLGPSMSGLLSGPVQRERSFTDDKKDAVDGLSESSFCSTSTTGRLRHPKTAANQSSSRDLMNFSSSTGRSAANDNQSSSASPVPATVKRPASFARAVISDVTKATESSRRDRVGASRTPTLDTQHEEESVSNILEISV